MAVTAVTAPITPMLTQTSQVANDVKSDASFSTALKDAINQVNTSQVESDTLTNKLVAGQNVELQDVMIASQKASITLNTALQVRNKVVEAYQEIMRMQV